MFQGRKQSERIETAASQASSAQQALKNLRERTEHHALLLEALWQVVSSRTGATEDELRGVYQALESQLERGERVAESCPSCGRPLQDNSKVCLYCGATHQQGRLFW